MTKREKEIAAILAAADSNRKRLKEAFLAAIDELRASFVDNEALEDFLASRNVESAVDAISVDALSSLLIGAGLPNNMLIFSNELVSVFQVGAGTALLNMSEEMQKNMSFDLLNERAVQFMRRDGATAIKEITDSTREGIRTAIIRSLEDGTNPAKQSKDIRQLIGLTLNQTQAVMNFRRQLETQQILGLTPPTERHLNAVDRAMIGRHMREGHFSQDQIDAMVEKYFQNLLNKRANDIARTEALNSINNGQLELWSQALDLGFLNDNEDRKFWVTTKDDRLRATHAVIPGMNPDGVKINGYFITPFGTVRGPGDRNVNLINCRCVLVLGQVGDKYQ